MNGKKIYSVCVHYACMRPWPQSIAPSIAITTHSTVHSASNLVRLKFPADIFSAKRNAQRSHTSTRPLKTMQIVQILAANEKIERWKSNVELLCSMDKQIVEWWKRWWPGGPFVSFICMEPFWLSNTEYKFPVDTVLVVCSFSVSAGCERNVSLLRRKLKKRKINTNNTHYRGSSHNSTLYSLVIIKITITMHMAYLIQWKKRQKYQQQQQQPGTPHPRPTTLAATYVTLCRKSITLLL